MEVAAALDEEDPVVEVEPADADEDATDDAVDAEEEACPELDDDAAALETPLAMPWPNAHRCSKQPYPSRQSSSALHGDAGRQAHAPAASANTALAAAKEDRSPPVLNL